MTVKYLKQMYVSVSGEIHHHRAAERCDINIL